MKTSTATQSTPTTYNGWKNRQTWNISLWINNDESLYRTALDYLKHIERLKERKSRVIATYAGFVKYAGLTDERTPDNISFSGTRLSHKELSAMIRELAE